MRKLLLLALLLYDVIAFAIRSGNYDYDEPNNSKIQFMKEDRRDWRKKALLKASEFKHKPWDKRRRGDYVGPRYLEEVDPKIYGGSEMDPSSYRFHRRYDEPEKMSIRSAEMGHPSSYNMEKDVNKKGSLTMNCNRPHERYETCFAGCASITCDNPRDRLRPCYPFCESGCICLHPYVRDDRTHKCVLPDDCTKGLKGIPDLGEEI